MRFNRERIADETCGCPAHGRGGLHERSLGQHALTAHFLLPADSHSIQVRHRRPRFPIRQSKENKSIFTH